MATAIFLFTFSTKHKNIAIANESDNYTLSV